jgi:hypothetical protein
MVNYMHVWWNVAVAKKKKKWQWHSGSGYGCGEEVAVDVMTV